MSFEGSVTPTTLVVDLNQLSFWVVFYLLDAHISLMMLLPNASIHHQWFLFFVDVCSVKEAKETKQTVNERFALNGAARIKVPGQIHVNPLIPLMWNWIPC